MLESVDLRKKLTDKDEYNDMLKEYQLRFLRMQRELQQSSRSLVIVVEGWDAGGKGGAIRRFTQRLDPRGFNVYATAAPEGHEKNEHYLKRFWKRIPEHGKIAVFDRSWYGRVLVERVEGFATKKEWKRAYEEINQFEKVLADDGTIIIKFWLHISKDEQLRRFEERQNNPFKRWKITDEDWRNREKWDDYVEAVEEMFKKTSTDYAPWHIISGEHKWNGRIEVIKRIVETLEKEMR
ncbi:polyphosphate kinase 2 family protein [Massilibacterium senegalense]|uniref:polyphosphate kinase 2 family protein n=1 Tax=Massilibacterium senegalense TaxID=1632858 RepID=UPI000AA01406|nr:UDP-galactose-lipid carrier transferase [Massilibacterium senegalense]